MVPLPSENSAPRHRDAFSIAVFVFEQPGCTRNDIQARMDADPRVAALSARSRTSCILLLNTAIENGWVERKGNHRQVTYAVTADFRTAFALNMVKSKANRTGSVGYDPEVLLSYEPNKSAYLTPRQRQFLASKGKASYPFDPTNEPARLAVRRFMTDISFHSSRLEGIRSNYADTLAFLEEGIQCERMSSHDAAILRNHHNTIRMMIEGISHPPLPNDITVSEYDIRVIHSSISDGLLKDRKDQGRLRTKPALISNSRYIPSSNPALISQMFAMLVTKAAQIHDPFEQSIFLAIHLPYLQPFVDCNKRTSRLAANIPMLRAGMIPFSWAHISAEDYNDTMVTMYEYQEARPFAELFAEAYSQSCERFEILMDSREPSRVEILFAKEIAENVRGAILEERPIQPPANASPVQAQIFVHTVRSILSDIVENEMVAAPYQIARPELTAWRKSASAPRHANSSETGDDSLAQNWDAPA